jgi:hypothetical protein
MAKTKTKTKTKKKTSEPMIVRSTNFGGGIQYQLRLVNCGNAKCRKGCNEGKRPHGPYWYRVEWNEKTKRSVAKYHGKNEPTLEEIARDLRARNVTP